MRHAFKATRWRGCVGKERAALIATALIAVLIAYLTLTDAPNGPGGLPHLDKLYHLIAFFCLVLPCALFHQRSLIWLIPSAISLAGLIEIIQPYVGREGDWLDFFADIVGVGLGFLLGHTLRRSKS